MWLFSILMVLCLIDNSVTTSDEIKFTQNKLFVRESE